MSGSNARQKLLHTFSVDFKSAVDDRRYIGDFTTKKLAIRDISALGVRKTQLNGGFHTDPANPGYGVDDQTDEFNNMLAHLEIALVAKPVWWRLDEITDLQLIAEVYKEVISFENNFLRREQPRTSSGDELGRSSEGSSTTAEKRPDVAGSPREVVAEEVQSALEP